MSLSRVELPMGDQQQLAQPATAALPSAAGGSCRTILIIDGSYAQIGARKLPGGRIDYVKFRDELERQAACRFRECWFFDHEAVRHKSPSQGLAAYYTTLKLAPPHGPQFQLKLYAMKKYACHCRRCGHDFTQNVQKGVDNGIATKALSLAYENVCDRFILFAGDGDFYDSLNLIKNVLRKDLWVIGYRDTVSADLQQLATHVIWLNDLWPTVQMAPASTPPASTSLQAATPEQAAPSNDDMMMEEEDEDASNGSRRVRIEKKSTTETQSEASARGRTKYRNRRKNGGDRSGRRNRSRSRSRSRSPSLRDGVRENSDDGDDEPPLFFIDKGPGRKQTDHPNARKGGQVARGDRDECGRSARRNAGRGPHNNDANKWVGYNASTQASGDDEGLRRGKKRRRDPPVTLTFELSDMSSEEDEQHPMICRPYSTAGPGSKMPLSDPSKDVTVINLASDSE